MATIRKQVSLAASPEAVWDAFRDFQHVDTRVARGFVIKSEPAGEGERMVTFPNGMVAHEELISCDDQARRLAYTASGGGTLKHHNGVFEVHPEGPEDKKGALVVWTLDILPHDAAPVISGMMDLGCQAMRQTLG